MEIRIAAYNTTILKYWIGVTVKSNGGLGDFCTILTICQISASDCSAIILHFWMTAFSS